MSQTYAVATRNVAGVLAALVLGAPTASHAPGAPVAVSAKLSEWKVELSASTVPAGTVTFTVTNAGTIPHAFEIEGHGIEKRSEEHTSELQSQSNLVCRLLLEKKKNLNKNDIPSYARDATRIHAVQTTQRTRCT